MAENGNENDVMTNAFMYSTIETTGLFEKGLPSYRLVRGGITILRVPWVSIWWGGAFAFFSFLFSFVILVKILHTPSYVYFPVIITIVILSALAGAKLCLWSPIKKDTGEDLVTYIMMVIRKKMGTASYGEKKQSTTEMLSQAIFEDGKLVTCKRFIGTQPLRGAAPSGPYEGMKTRYIAVPSGEAKKIDTSLYRDKAGDR